MNYEAYKALENKMDKLYSDFVDKSATIETEGDVKNVSDWLDNEYDEILTFAKENNANSAIIKGLESDYFKLKVELIG